MRTSIYGQRQPRSNPADVCKNPRKACNVTRRIFRRLFPAGHEIKKTYTVTYVYTCYRLLTLQISVVASFYITIGAHSLFEVYIIQGTNTSHTCKKTTSYVRIHVVSCVWVGSCMYTYGDNNIMLSIFCQQQLN